jgi:hypothetical protein
VNDYGRTHPRRPVWHKEAPGRGFDLGPVGGLLGTLEGGDQGLVVVLVMGGRVLELVDDGDDLFLLPGAETGVVEGEEELEALGDGNVESRLQLLVGLFISCDVPAGRYGEPGTEMRVAG